MDCSFRFTLGKVWGSQISNVDGKEKRNRVRLFARCNSNSKSRSGEVVVEIIDFLEM